MITNKAKAAAVESGERALLNHPVRVELDSGAVATLDLTAAVKGVPNPYCITTTKRELVHIDLARGGIESPSETLHIGGMRVSDRDRATVRAALALAPGIEARHDPKANSARLEAGKIALAVRDNMVRARLLDHIDGWMALKDASDVVDQSEEGLLLKPKQQLGFTCLVLVVRCPSTGRVYALRVPEEHKTAKDARRWVMKGAEPEVET